MEARASSILPFLAIHLLLLLHLSSAQDSLLLNQSISDGQSLLSAGKNFELGFFSPTNSSNRYLGIWYHKIPVQTIVWVANKDSPLMDNSGLLTIQSDGNLALIDGTRTILWSTSISGIESGNYSTIIARLMDSGNLALYMSGKNMGKTIWQSFDHPTDTLLPGMRIGFNLRPGLNRKLTSWRSSTDPAAGNFTYGLDPNDSYQFFIWNQSVRYWRSGTYNGRAFNRIPEASSSFLFHFSLVKSDEELYFEYSAMYNNTRLKMDSSGQIRCMIWYDATQTWGVAWNAPAYNCGVYGSCGPNSICSDFEQPMCGCLPGFEPVSPKRWSSGDWASGCKRRAEMVCGMKHGFLSAGKLKVPDLENLVEAGSDKLCRDECSKNCSCSAYVFADMGGGGDSQCLLWYGSLLDVGNLKQIYGSEEIFIKVAQSELDSNEKKVSPTSISVITIAAVLILGTFLCLLWKRKIKYKGTGRRKDQYMFSSSSENVSVDIQLLHGTHSGEDVKDGLEIPFYSFISILLATNHFSESNLLGEGGFGRVYKGQLPGEREIAVKRLSRCSGQGVEEFKTEIKLIAKLQHRNLVRLLGCCIEKNEKMLVYEYMGNKSLDSFIFDLNKCKQLNWEKRFNIILGIARGLVYLHQDSRLRIIHRDLKASNILLDEEMTPKISDFGMARIFQGNETQGNTRRVVGTYGYMSPEYALDGLFSVKSDVFSFGVIVLEIVSGKKNNHFYHEEDSLSLLGYAWKLWNEEEEMKLLEPQILESAIPWQVLRCIQLGLLCVQEDPADRPTMSAVIADLVSESLSLPLPKGPATYVRKYHFSQGKSLKNDLTITHMEGR